MNGTHIQSILVGLSSIITALMPIILFYLRERFGPSPQPTGDDPAPSRSSPGRPRAEQDPRKTRALTAERQILLSCSLILLAICCLLMLHTLTAFTTWGPGVIFASAAILCVTVVWLSFLAWKKNSLLLIIACWCISTSLLVTTAHFIHLVTDTEPFEFPYFSVTLLFLVSVAAATYYRGLPGRPAHHLENLRPWPRRLVERYLWPVVLITPLLAILISGFRIASYLESFPYVTRSTWVNHNCFTRP